MTLKSHNLTTGLQVISIVELISIQLEQELLKAKKQEKNIFISFDLVRFILEKLKNLLNDGNERWTAAAKNGTKNGTKNDVFGTTSGTTAAAYGITEEDRDIHVFIIPNEKFEYSSAIVSLLKNMKNIKLIYLMEKKKVEELEGNDQNFVLAKLNHQFLSVILKGLFLKSNNDLQFNHLVLPVSSTLSMQDWTLALATLFTDSEKSELKYSFVTLGQQVSSNSDIKSISIIDAVTSARAAMALGNFVGIETGACLAFLSQSQPLRSNTTSTISLILQIDSTFSYPFLLLNDEFLHQHGILTTTNPDKNSIRKWVIDDLQLPEATTVFQSDPLCRALEIMTTHDFSQLPVVNESRRVVGLISMSLLSSLPPSTLHEQVVRHMFKFPRGSKYEVVTVDTELDQVEEMLKKTPAVFITDSVGKFPLGVVTKSDLEKFFHSISRQS